MNETDPWRRQFLKQSLAGGAIVPLANALPGLSVTAGPTPADPAAGPTLKVLCVGGHPDDPESGCGGTLARYAAMGHQVTVVYLTRGERGIRGKSLDEAARIRTAEAEAACRILGARAVFAGQIDGATELNRERVTAFTQLLAGEAPDLVFTHWPIDTHLDHQMASLLTMRAYLSSPRRFRLYFFEVNSGYQTLGFRPTDYVDIASTRETKRQALFAHKSQDGEKIYRDHHRPMEEFRGREAGVPAAEAFAFLARDDQAARRLSL